MTRGFEIACGKVTHGFGMKIDELIQVFAALYGTKWYTDKA